MNGRSRASRRGWAQALIALGLLVAACSRVAPGGGFTPAAVATDRPIEVLGEGYSTSDTCRSCHPDHYNSWNNSYHRTMTQVPTVQNVVAPFDGEELVQDGKRFRAFQRGDEFFVEMDDPDWTGPPTETPRVERKVVLSTGSHHIQVYWVPDGASRRLRFFEFCYRIAQQRWVTVASVFLAPSGAHMTPGGGRWNFTCLRCHATRSEPRIESPAEMDTQVTEFGIACEACHGPGEEHVRANQDPLRRYQLHLFDGDDPTIVQPERLAPREGSMVCGQCHAVTSPIGPEGIAKFKQEGYTYVPGEDIEDTRVIKDSGDTQFWADGMVRVSGREYNGLIESPCYDHGDPSQQMTCYSCHQLHQKHGDDRPPKDWADDQLAPMAYGNAACTQCHAEYADDGPLAAHSRHAADSSGSQCYNCHMPHTTWGLLKGIRSHTVSAPSVDESLHFGRPNACNLCHLDRTLGWTADKLESWYGQERPTLSDDQENIAASVLWLLSGDAGQRALLSWHLGWEPAREVSGSKWMAPYLSQLLDDPYEAVRFRAHLSLETLEGFAGFEYDFLADREQRVEGKLKAYKHWRSLRPDLRETHKQTLISRKGELREKAFVRLLGLRDDRPVLLAE